MDQQQQTRRRKWFLWTGGTTVTLVIMLLLIRIGYGYNWTGFGQSKVNESVQAAKTLWDWLNLAIVPIVLAIGGYLFNSSQNRATQTAAERRGQDEALQAYLDHMSDMLIPNKDYPSVYNAHPDHPDDSLSSVVRARTLTVLSRIDGDRKARVVQFLYESGLIYKYHHRLNESRLIESQHPIVILSQADLRKAKLIGATLIGAYFGEADLSGADLSWASLYKAVLGGVNLSKASLKEAWLDYAILTGANLSRANLSGAGLVEAMLGGANLERANLSHANLRHADLSYANLIGAKVTQEQLKQAKTLEGATMPNGRKYVDRPKY